jgi:hypothetical protein
MDFEAFVEYQNSPGDKKLNYVRTRAIGANGTQLPVTFRLEWPGGSVSCPGSFPPKAEGWCEFTATEGEFTLQLEGRAQPLTIVVPRNDAHTIATVVWRRFW